MKTKSDLIQIGTKESGGKIIKLLINTERTRAYIKIDVIGKFVSLREQEFEDLFERHRIVVSDKLRENLKFFVIDANQPDFDNSSFETMDPLLVSEGIDPVSGRDGRIEWHVEVPVPGKARPKVRPDTDTIDLRELGRVVNVREGDVLLTVHAPTKGEPGVDIHGKSIPTRNGEAVRINRGKGVIIKDDKFISAIEGCVDWTGTTLSVEPVYTVSRNLDFDIGNIDFNGSVIVRGDVLDGFTVKARDSIEVFGTVGQCSLICEEGNITLRGGIAGAGTGKINSGGNVIAKYITNADVQCNGDLITEREIINCTINCCGRITAQGTIVGSTVVALGGIVVDTVGSESGTKTQLILNYEHFQTEETRVIDSEIRVLEQQAGSIERRLGSVVNNREHLHKIHEDKRREVTQEIGRFDDISEKIYQKRKSRDSIVRRYAARVSHEITVRQRLHVGTDVRIDTCRHIFNQSINGPIRLRPDYARGTIQVTM